MVTETVIIILRLTKIIMKMVVINSNSDNDSNSDNNKINNNTSNIIKVIIEILITMAIIIKKVKSN